MAGVTNTKARSTAIDAYLTMIADTVAPTLADAVGRSCPTLGELTAKGRKQPWTGGRVYAEPIMYDFTSGFKSVGPWEKLTLVGSDGITEAMYPAAEYHLPVAIDGPQIRANMGDGRIKDVVKTKFKQAEATQKNKMSQHLWDIANVSTTSTGNGGKNIIPIPMMVAAASTIYPGGINPGTYTWWDNPRVAGNSMSTSAALLNGLDQAGLEAAKYMGGMPDIAVTSLVCFRGVITALRALQHIVESVTGESGFRGIKIGSIGGVPLFWEEHMCDAYTGTNYTTSDTTTNVYFLNSANLKLRVREGLDWKPSEFKSMLPHYDVHACSILWEGQLTCDNRLKNSVLYRLPLSWT